jgi:glutamate formiminotransferase
MLPLDQPGEVYPLDNIEPRPLDGPLVQSAVNFSEGRRPDTIRAILQAAEGGSGAGMADWSADYDHNRLVVTFLGGLGAVCRSILSAARVAVERIDLREHSGAHPRAGAVDVVPLVPIREVTIEECVEASLSLGEEIARSLDLPVYLYEHSARSGRRSLLPDIRRGGFEGLFRQPLSGERSPDFGPAAPHPTAGITVIGARGPLVAYNVVLATEDVSIARKVAADIRARRSADPSLAGIRALGIPLPTRGLSQVSMNLTLPELTPLPAVYDFVSHMAHEFGTEAEESEIIGLIPRFSLDGDKPERIRWVGYHPRQIIENWL